MTLSCHTINEERQTLCFLGCGNMGVAILNGLLSQLTDNDSQNGTQSRRRVIFKRFNLCVQSADSEQKLTQTFAHQQDRINVFRRQNVEAMRQSDVLILSCKPHMVDSVLSEDGVVDALRGKLLISIVAGWTRPKLEQTLYGSATTSENAGERSSIARAMPNTAALISESATAIEISELYLHQHLSDMVDVIFQAIGSVYHVRASQMDVCTALGGSTPAFLAIICDALIDGAVAMGMTRQCAKDMTYQALRGTAGLLQAGDSPSSLKEKVTSPGGCTIGAIMLLEEAGLRGTMSKALRESATIASLLGQGLSNVNGTRVARY